MAKKKIFTKKNALILFLLSCLSAAIVVGVVHAQDASERLATAELSTKTAQALTITAQTKIVNLEQENRALKIILQIVSSQTCPAPIECAEPIECAAPVECPAPVTCKPEIITIRIVEKEEVIKEIKVPIACTETSVESEKRLEGFTPYLDLERRTDGTDGVTLGIDKEVANKGRFSIRFFAELSHNIVQKNTTSTEIDSYYCEELQCPENAPQGDHTRGNFGIRFRF